MAPTGQSLNDHTHQSQKQPRGRH
ncbi:protein of unknown function (plasmid) [Paraburkholderia dioscoreae]|uniref:Uncharacterized protein n=1 Tax=Paraburkholderia dioscoreae TaxID=2604047 RepID=A0A5Q4YWR6_9BURK|nr:protein of unknown function [Paraburkholderia dioscoreae]